MQLPVSSSEQVHSIKGLPLLGRPGTWRLQINVIPIPDGQGPALRPQLPHLPVSALLPVFSTAIPADLAEDDTGLIESLKAGKKLDDQTMTLLRDLQVRGASGLALELLNPQLDGIVDPEMRLKFASILFDMMHVRGRYAEAAELIRQELLLHPHCVDQHSLLLLPLKIRQIHHQMFYRPVMELWAQMVDLLAGCNDTQDSDSYGEILFMLGGNMGTLSGDYCQARSFLIRAIRHAKNRKDH